ncbi:MAG TPA: sterol desaturase family protein [Cyclobacteriaceae bacterium]|jgi:sterol desaturase/sphingolipid hydroxylase (fatty acid hydroxylase superfamily)
MEKEKLTLEQVINLGTPDVIRYAVPVMIILVLAEWGISYYQKKEIYNKRDLLAATLIGTGNLIVSALIKTSLFVTFLFIINLMPWSIPPTWWSYILCIIAIDFFRYWGHRVAHENRFWWATHVTHHNSKKYNWSVSFRLSWVQHIKFVFFIPVAMMGFHPVVFFICHQIEVLYQFWIHTEYIRKLPKPIEYIFTTPSHHRVHHATNAKYIDKNYGSTLIIWDRMFGTFQPEEEQAIYGITKPLTTYNPITLVFHEWRDICKDLYRAKNIKEARKYLFGRPSELSKQESESAE